MSSLETLSSNDAGSALRGFGSAMRRQAVWAVGAGVVVIAVVLGLTSLQTPRYSTFAEMVIRTEMSNSLFPSVDGVDEYALRFTSAELTFMRSDAFTDAIEDEFGEDVKLDIFLKDPVLDQPGERSNTFVLRSEATSPQVARDIVDSAIERYRTERRDNVLSDLDAEAEQINESLEEALIELEELLSPVRDIERRLATETDSVVLAQLLTARSLAEDSAQRATERLDASIDRLDSRSEVLLNARPALARTNASAQVLVAAEIVDSPFSPDWVRNTALALFLAMIAGVALATVRELLGGRINSQDDIIDLGLVVLASVPKAERGATDLERVSTLDPGSIRADGYQRARTSLQNLTYDEDMKIVVVTSPNQGDGKTTTAVNLALTFAQTSQQVLLADIDTRRPRIHRVFGMPLEPGFTTSIDEDLALEDIAITQGGLEDSLRVVSAGPQPANPAAYLSSPEVRSILNEVRDETDLTILDAPPVLPVADALAIGRYADGVILVCRAGQTTKTQLSLAASSVISSGGRLLGVVLNGSKEVHTSYTYGADAKRSITRGGRPFQRNGGSRPAIGAAPVIEAAPELDEVLDVDTVGETEDVLDVGSVAEKDDVLDLDDASDHEDLDSVGETEEFLDVNDVIEIVDIPEIPAEAVSSVAVDEINGPGKKPSEERRSNQYGSYSRFRRKTKHR